MNTESQACILDLSNQMRTAISVAAMKQFIIDPVLSEMPLTPPYCRFVVPWKQSIVPCIDVGCILSNTPKLHPPGNKLLVVCYTDNVSLTTHYGGLLIASSPQIVSVNDEQAQKLPKHPIAWKTISHSCFSHQGTAIPVLNLPLLFSKKFCDLSQAFAKHQSNRQEKTPLATQ